MTTYDRVIDCFQIFHFRRILDLVLHFPDLVLEVLDFLRAVFLGALQSIKRVSDFLGLVLL